MVSPGEDMGEETLTPPRHEVTMATVVVSGDHRVHSFDAGFVALIVALRETPPEVGEPLEDVVGARYWPVVAIALERARGAGTATSMLHSWGVEHHNYGLTVAFDTLPSGRPPEQRVFRCTVWPLSVALARDPQHRFSGALLANMTEMIAVFDRDFGLQAFNAPYAAGAEALTGQPLRIGDNLLQLMAAPSLPAWMTMCDRAFTGESVIQDFTVTLAVGLQLTYEVSLNPLRDAAGVVDGLLLVSRNVTKSRAASRALEKVADFRRATLEAMPDAVTVFDRSMRIVDFKGALGVPIPMPAQSLVGANLRDMSHAPADRIAEVLERAFVTREPQRFDYEAQVEGAVRQRSAWAHRISDDEALWVVRDVTEEKAVAQRLAFADRMASLGTLAAGVAHEINNPLQYVLSNVELARSHDEATPEVRALLGEALDGLLRASSIVASLRTFSRAQEPERTTVDVASVVHQALKLVAMQVKNRATLVVDAATTAAVSGSPTRLTQVVVNLLLNAVDALEGRDKRASVVRITTHHRALDRIAIEIADNGPGIGEHDRHRIFDPFFTTKPVGQGTGLGLSIASQIVRGSGGEIEVESSPEKGTLFRVLLPILPDRADVERAPASSPTPPPADLPPRILVVDDDHLVRDSLGRLLSKYRITIAESGEEALRAFSDGEFDAALCDVAMPGMSGIELVREVASRWPGREGTIVLMTGGLVTDEQREELGPGAPIILNKPFSQRALADALAGAIQRQPERS